MARTFVLTDIVDPVKAPFSKRSLEHINEAYNELSKQVIESTFTTAYTSNDVIILSGCEVVANIPGTSSVTAGQIYYNGKIYNVDANASISTPANTLVWSIATTYISGDPATFSDGNNYDFHKIEKFQLTNAVSGSGIANYNGATVKYKIRKIKYNIGAWNMDVNNSVQITTSLNNTIFASKVINTEVVIISDAGDVTNVVDSSGIVNSWTTYTSGGGFLIIQFNRLTGGLFDNSSFDDAVINRGYGYLLFGDI